MTNRVLQRARVVAPCAAMAVACIAAIALLAPRAHAQDPEFRSTVSVAAGPTFPVGARHPFDDPGSTYVATISVGDDFSTVGFSDGGIPGIGTGVATGFSTGVARRIGVPSSVVKGLRGTAC